jgi:hypothetical protein
MSVAVTRSPLAVVVDRITVSMRSTDVRGSPAHVWLIWLNSWGNRSRPGSGRSSYAVREGLGL